MKIYFENNKNFFNKELNRRKMWLMNSPDLKAQKEWKKIQKKIIRNKKFDKVKIAYNFSKNVNYHHPGLSSSNYFYHPLRVCILSTKINLGLSPKLMTLGLLHNIFETTNIQKNLIKKIFGNQTTKQLEALTVNRKNEWKKNYKNNYYNKLVRSGKNVIIIKILDKMDNLYLLKNNKDNMIKERYLKEIETFLMPLIKRELSFLYSHFIRLIEFSKNKKI